MRKVVSVMRFQQILDMMVIIVMIVLLKASVRT